MNTRSSYLHRIFYRLKSEEPTFLSFRFCPGIASLSVLDPVHGLTFRPGLHPPITTRFKFLSFHPCLSALIRGSSFFFIRDVPSSSNLSFSLSRVNEYP